MPASSRYKDLLDYTISYRAVWTLLGFVVVVAVAAYLLWSQVRPPAEDERARQDVKAAERLQHRAEACGAPADSAQGLQATLDQASKSMTAARTALDERKWADAAEQARVASDGYKKYIEDACTQHEDVARFVDLVGDVQIKKHNSPRWVSAHKETTLEEGDRISTESGGYARVVFDNGESQDLREGSILEIRSAKRQADGVLQTETKLEEGGLSMVSQPGTGSKVSTPYAIIEPKGDRVEVENPKGMTTTRVRSDLGGATVTDLSGKTTTLIRSTRVDASPAGLTQPLPELPVPELVEPVDGRVFTLDKPDTADTSFNWRALDGAKGYRFNLGVSESFYPLLNKEDQDVPGLAAVIGGLAPGQYRWRLAGVDPQGVAGAWSETRRFTIRAKTDTTKLPPPPLIEIVNHTKFYDKVYVDGKTNPYATVEAFVGDVKSQDVTVNEDGTFKAFVPLPKEGKNVIRFVAHDQYGQKNETHFEEFLTID